MLTWILSHPHTIKATFLPGFSPCTYYQCDMLTWLVSMHILPGQHAYPVPQLETGHCRQRNAGSWLKVVSFLDHLSDIKTLSTDTKLKVSCTEDDNGQVKRYTQMQSSGKTSRILSFDKTLDKARPQQADILTWVVSGGSVCVGGGGMGGGVGGVENIFLGT